MQLMSNMEITPFFQLHNGGGGEEGRGGGGGGGGGKKKRRKFPSASLIIDQGESIESHSKPSLAH